MKSILLLLILFATTSCSSTKTVGAPLQDQINDLEVKTAQEMNNHAQLLLDNHPELSEPLKLKIKSYLDVTMKKHQALKDEESRVIQLMLQKSLSHDKQGLDLNDNMNLRSHLVEIYKSKSSNIFDLILEINKMSKNSEISDSVKKDVFLFMRDFR